MPALSERTSLGAAQRPPFQTLASEASLGTKVTSVSTTFLISALRAPQPGTRSVQSKLGHLVSLWGHYQVSGSGAKHGGWYKDEQDTLKPLGPLAIQVRTDQ